jgi:hypothetical protein
MSTKTAKQLSLLVYGRPDKMRRRQRRENSQRVRSAGNGRS